MSEMARTCADPVRPGVCDPDEFQLPMPGLFADLELGRGSVLLSEDYGYCSSLVKLQLLRDWQRSLGRYRDQALQQFARELTAGVAHLQAGERAALVRTTCEALRIDVPSDFAALTAHP